VKLALIALVVVGAAGVTGGCRSWTHDEDSRDRSRTTATQDPYDRGFDRDSDRSRSVATQDNDTTTTIRRRIADASLSANARNTSITTQNGYVTLRGPVDSQTEKSAVARIAREVAGEGRVYDLTDVVQAR
jgi:osmotically-inducible protein OsmY